VAAIIAEERAVVTILDGEAQMTIAATFAAALRCPGCDLIMYNEDTNVVGCLTPGCLYKGVRFKRPTFLLETAPLVVEEKVVVPVAINKKGRVAWGALRARILEVLSVAEKGLQGSEVLARAEASGDLSKGYRALSLAAARGLIRKEKGDGRPLYYKV